MRFLLLRVRGNRRIFHVSQRFFHTSTSQRQKPAMKKLLTVLLTVGLVATAPGQVAITGDYSQNFDTLGDGLPAGWGIYGAVTSTSLGNSLSFANTNPAIAANTWSNTTGAFKNLASATGLAQDSSVAVQQASLNRALGIRPSGTFGDAATNFTSFNFNFSTLGFEVTGLSLDAMVLATEGRTKLWDIQYGVGVSPTTWATLDTLTSFDTWGTTSYSFDNSDFGTDLDDQASVWFRFSSTALSSGSGSRPTVGIDNFEITAVPEPSTYALLALSGLALAGYAARRRQRQK